MTQIYKIEKDVPNTTHKRTKWPFGDMEVGDSFALDAIEYIRVHAAASYYGKRNGKKFSVKKSGDKYRCWRTA